MANGQKKIITKADLQASYARTLGKGEEVAPDFVPPAVASAGVIAGFSAFVLFLLGRRRGRKRQSVVEIHRTK